MQTTGLITEQGTSKTVVVDGMPIHYHEAGSGPPLLMLHSYNSGSTAWLMFHRNVETLAKEFRCIMMDMLNFGGTGPLIYQEYSHALHGRTVISLMDALDIERASILGNSVGGSSALAVAAMKPERVDRLVVGGCHLPIGGAVPEPFGLVPAEGARANNEVIANPSKENIRRNLLVHLYDHRLVTDEMVNYMYQDIADHPQRHLAVSKSKSLPDTFLLSAVQSLEAPTLIVHGRDDRMVSVDYAVTMLNVLPKSRLMVFNQCGHWPPYEYPDEYNEQALHFLRDV